MKKKQITLFMDVEKGVKEKVIMGELFNRKRWKFIPV